MSAEKHVKVRSSIFPRLGGSRTKRTCLIGRMEFRVLFCSQQDVQNIRALNAYVKPALDFVVESTTKAVSTHQQNLHINHSITEPDGAVHPYNPRLKKIN
jgi:hypothetical protein